MPRYATKLTVEAVTIEEEPVKNGYEDFIEKSCRGTEVKPDVVRAIIKVESDWNPNCIGDYGESYGLMQIQPRWHEQRMERLSVNNLLDPEQNVMVGVDILNELLKDHNLQEALTIYNAGHLTSDRSYYLKVKGEMKND